MDATQPPDPALLDALNSAQEALDRTEALPFPETKQLEARVANLARAVVSVMRSPTFDGSYRLELGQWALARLSPSSHDGNAYRMVGVIEKMQEIRSMLSQIEAEKQELANVDWLVSMIQQNQAEALREQYSADLRHILGIGQGPSREAQTVPSEDNEDPQDHGMDDSQDPEKLLGRVLGDLNLENLNEYPLPGASRSASPTSSREDDLRLFADHLGVPYDARKTVEMEQLAKTLRSKSSEFIRDRIERMTELYREGFCGTPSNALYFLDFRERLDSFPYLWNKLIAIRSHGTEIERGAAFEDLVRRILNADAAGVRFLGSSQDLRRAFGSDEDRRLLRGDGLIRLLVRLGLSSKEIEHFEASGDTSLFQGQPLMEIDGLVDIDGKPTLLEVKWGDALALDDGGFVSDKVMAQVNKYSSHKLKDESVLYVSYKPIPEEVQELLREKGVDFVWMTKV